MAILSLIAIISGAINRPEKFVIVTGLVGTHRIIDFSFIPPTDYSTMKNWSYSHP